MAREPGRGIGPAPAQPMFLRPQSYKLRRLVDGARMLPALGAVLVYIPLLWQAGSMPVSTVGAGLYLFGIWFGLILLAGALAPALRRVIEAESRDSEQG